MKLPDFKAKLSRIIAKLRKADIDAVDALLVTGAGLVVYGVELIYSPAAYIIAGMFLLTLGVMRLPRKAK